MRTARNRFVIAPVLRAALVVGAMMLAGTAFAGEQGKTFSSPEKAVEALLEALRADDVNVLVAIFGDESRDVFDSGDPVQDANDRSAFVEGYDRSHRIDRLKNQATLIVGEREWPFPIPIVKGKGGWAFDTAAGREEILNRRIGRNELSAIQALLEVVDAQRAYAARDWDYDGLLEYASLFRSGVGMRNGLYWPTEEGEALSPLGLLIDEARGEGYSAGNTNYRGYQYRILTSQGPDARGGARDYMVRGNLIGGYAVLAWPVEWGDSGVMSFLVGYDGVVYEKDLGAQTLEKAKAIESYNPDSTWVRVPEEALKPVEE